MADDDDSQKSLIYGSKLHKILIYIQAEVWTASLETEKKKLKN